MLNSVDPHTVNRSLLTPLREALDHWDEGRARGALDNLVSADARLHLSHPFDDVTGPQGFYDAALAPLRAAWPDVERRDWIVMAGQDDMGNQWIGAGGHYVGTFVSPFLDIPPTGHLAHMRFHEYWRVENGRAVELQAIWDLPEVMMQAGAWPMAPSLGAELWVPGPATCDGLRTGERDAAESETSLALVRDMLAHLNRYPGQGGPEVMEMPRFWHEAMSWYGPAGIGTCRGIRGFRNWHSIPFLSAMPDRGQYPDQIRAHFFADGPYVAVTGWPDMMQTVTGDGWMGIAPSGTRVTMRSLDFWRIEAGRIRENWVLVDLLDVYRQLGVDVFRRLREFNKARVPGSVAYPVGEP